MKNMNLWHLFGLLLIGWGVYQCFFALPLPPHLAAGGNFQFLTNCGVFLSLVYAVLNNLGIRLTRLYYLVGSLELEITVAYWYFITFAAGLLNTDDYQVLLLNDCSFHLFPFVYVMGCYPRRQVSFGEQLGLSALGFGGYWAYIEYLHHYVGAIYPYPFMRGALLSSRLTYIVVFFAVGLGFYPLDQVKRRFQIGHSGGGGKKTV